MRSTTQAAIRARINTWLRRTGQRLVKDKTAGTYSVIDENNITARHGIADLESLEDSLIYVERAVLVTKIEDSQWDPEYKFVYTTPHLGDYKPRQTRHFEYLHNHDGADRLSVGSIHIFRLRKDDPSTFEVIQ